MNEKKIKLAGTEEVRDFVREAGKCDFDIDISYNRVIIDAKSFLGVLSLDLNRELTVKYGGHDMNFENVLSKCNFLNDGTGFLAARKYRFIR